MGRAQGRVTGELSHASVYVSLLPVVEACVVVAVPGRVGPERVLIDPKLRAFSHGASERGR